MPAIPLFITDPLWSQFQALIPPVVDEHPLGCHRPRIPDRVVFDKLIQVLVLGASYEKISDTTCSATTMRRRRDEWITAGIFTALEQICLDSYDRIVGLELDDLCVDGCIVKAPCGGEIAGKFSPVRPWQTRHQTFCDDRRRRHPSRCDRSPGQPQRLTLTAPDVGTVVAV